MISSRGGGFLNEGLEQARCFGKRFEWKGSRGVKSPEVGPANITVPTWELPSNLWVAVVVEEVGAIEVAFDALVMVVGGDRGGRSGDRGAGDVTQGFYLVGGAEKGTTSASNGLLDDALCGAIEEKRVHVHGRGRR